MRRQVPGAQPRCPHHRVPTLAIFDDCFLCLRGPFSKLFRVGFQHRGPVDFSPIFSLLINHSSPETRVVWHGRFRPLTRRGRGNPRHIETRFLSLLGAGKRCGWRIEAKRSVVGSQSNSI